MIPPAVAAEILRLYYAEKWKIGTIAAQLGIHHSTIHRVVAETPPHAGRASLRPSIADPFIPFIVETLEKYPRLRASRLYVMVRDRGYTGAPDHFRAIVARFRPRPPAEAYLRLRTLPGEQAQVDWGHFGKLAIGQAERALMAFVLVLSWSRQIFLRFFLGSHMANFLRGHVEAFALLDGVPRVILYDNLKSAVSERVGDAIRFNPTLLELAAHYRFGPRPVAPARGNEKGRVERAIRYIREAFFAARCFTDLADLNAQALAWSQGQAADRPWPDNRAQTVREAFATEKTHLIALPQNPFETDERVEVKLGRTPYVRFDLNDYSVPHLYVRRILVVTASLDTVRVLDGDKTIASHPRSWGRGEQIEDPSHIAALVEHKREARKHRGMDRLHCAVPSSEKLFIELAQRGANLGSSTSRLLRLLDAHGSLALEEAVAEALACNTPHLAAIRHILDRKKHERGQKLPGVNYT